jgi:hypothetical protein
VGSGVHLLTQSGESSFASLVPCPPRSTFFHPSCRAGVDIMSGLGRSNLIDASPSFSDSQEDSDEGQSWIEWWTHLKGNEFLCEVSEEFLRDEFNLYGFSSQVILLKCSSLAVDVSNMFFGAIIT